MDNVIFKKVGATILGILILGYVIYQVFIINNSTVQTETAIYTEMEDLIDVDVWFVRDDVLITSNVSGVTSFVLDDGEKVSNGEVIAQIYYDETSASKQRSIQILEEEIENLEKLISAGDSYSSDSALIGSQINDEITDFLLSVNDNDFDDLNSYRTQLQYLINKKGIITGDEDLSIYSTRITELQLQRDALVSNYDVTLGYIYSPNSGYFSSNVDGYENSFDFDNIADITVSDIENVDTSNDPDSSIAKVSKGFTWYTVAIIDEQQKIKLEDKTKVTIKISSADVDEIPADIVSINYDEESGNYALVLSSNYSSEELSAMRYESVQIIVNSYSGVVVSESAVCFKDITETVVDEDGNETEIVHENVKGVYVKFGSQISFVQIFDSVTINGYVVCKLTLSDAEKELLYTDNISLYDEVIVGGIDFSDY